MRAGPWANAADTAAMSHLRKLDRSWDSGAMRPGHRSASPSGRATSSGLCSLQCLVLRTWLQALLTLAPLPLLPAASTIATEPPTAVRLSGTAFYSFIDWDTSRPIVQHHDQFLFDLSADGAWSMITRSTIDTNAHFVAAYDKTNVYTIYYATRGLKDRESFPWGDPVPLEKGNHLATVSPGPYLLDFWSPHVVTWLALAGSVSLTDDELTHMPAPWRDARQDLLAYAFAVEPAYALPHAKILTQALFFTAPLRHTEPPYLESPTTASAYRSRIQQQEMLRMLPHGRLAARYTVQQWTNLAGLAIPLLYRFEVYPLGLGVDITNQTPASLVTGQVTNVALLPAVTAPPTILGTLSVRDYRFRYRDARNVLDFLRYGITNGMWKSTNDLFLRAGFEVVKVRSPRYQPSRDLLVKRAILIGILGLALALPFILHRLVHRAR